MSNKFVVQVSDLIKVYARYLHDIYIESTESQKLHGPSHSVWVKIADDLGNKISSKYAYTIALQNRYNVLPKTVTKSEDKSSSGNQSSSLSEESGESLTKKDISSDYGLQFEITIPKSIWDDLYTTVEYKCKHRQSTRLYSTLKCYEWTNFMQTFFFNSTRLPCPIRFRRCPIHQEGRVFLKMAGECSECGSNFEGCVETPPNFEYQSEVIVKCVYKSNAKNQVCRRKKHLHSRKHQLEYGEQLINQQKSASYIRRAKAKEEMNYGDFEPSHLPTNNALRILKHKILKSNQLDKNPILAIGALKGIYPYSEIIHDIGYDRFFVHYWSVTEQNSYRLYTKFNKVSRVSIDATGDVVKKIVLESNSKMKALFLYEIVVNDESNNVQFSVGHMISSRHDNYWLTEWLKNGIPTPKIVITDMSLALMMAVVKSCTQYSTLKKYIQVCSSLLNNEPNIDVPTTMLRCDFAHTMHLISRWSELNISNCSRRTKQFYMHSVALLVGCTDFVEIKELLHHIFTVALNEGGGFNKEGQETASRVSKHQLSIIIGFRSIEKRCENFESLNPECDYDDNEFDLVITDETVPQNDFFSQIKNVYSTCEEASHFPDNEGDEDNAQFSPGIAKRLLKLCTTLPLWSAVMNEVFGYGQITESSAPVDSSFNDVKNRIFKHKTLPIRVDEFVLIHIDAILGNMNLINAHYNTSNPSNDRNADQIVEHLNTKLDNKQIKNKCDNMNEDPTLNFTTDVDIAEIDSNQSTENWRGQGVPLKKRKIKPRHNYLQCNKTILPVNKQSKTVSKVIGILKNGNLLPLISVQINSKYYTLNNTCPFDTVIQLMMTAYCDSLLYQSFIDSSKEEHLLCELVANTVRDGVNPQTYSKRANLLHPIFKSEKFVKGVGYHVIIDCATNVNFMLSQLLVLFPSLTESFKCTDCGELREIKNYGMSIAATTGTIGGTLSSIPQQLEIEEHQYFLRGAVSFIPPITRTLVIMLPTVGEMEEVSGRFTMI